MCTNEICTVWNRTFNRDLFGLESDMLTRFMSFGGTRHTNVFYTVWNRTCKLNMCDLGEPDIQTRFVQFWEKTCEQFNELWVIRGR